MNQCKTKDATTYMYIDNGLLNLLTSKNENTEKFFKEISIKTPHNKNNCRMFPTSFSFLEFIGLTPRKILPGHQRQVIVGKYSTSKVARGKGDKKIDSTEEYYEKLAHQIRDKVEENGTLSLGNIKTLQKKRLEEIDNPLRKAWEKHPFFMTTDQIQLDNIKKDFIHDILSQHKLEKPIINDVYSMICGDICKAITKDNSNFPFARFATILFKYCISKYPDSYQRKIMEDFISNAQYHEGKDLMDTELIHMTTIGYFNEGKRHPVYAYTCDDYEKVLSRIFIYKFILEGIFKMIKQEVEIRKNQDIINQIENYSIAEGKIVCLNHDIQIEKVLDVKEILGNFEWFEQHIFPILAKKYTFFDYLAEKYSQSTFMKHTLTAICSLLPIVSLPVTISSNILSDRATEIRFSRLEYMLKELSKNLSRLNENKIDENFFKTEEFYDIVLSVLEKIRKNKISRKNGHLCQNSFRSY